MNLGELIVDLSLDYAEFNQSLEQAKKAASSAAASIEKSFQKLSLSNPAGTDKSPQKLSLKVEVDDSALYSLNKHLALKDRHFKEVNQYFKNNPLTPTVDDRELTNLNKELAQLTGKNAGGRARVSVDVEVNKEKANLIINNNNNSKEIVEQLKSVEKAVIDSAELSLGRSLGIGITEEFGRVIGKNLMSGFKKNLGLDIAGATQSFTRVVSKPLSKVTPESIQKFEDDIVSALEDAFVFKNQAQAEEKFKAAFQPIVDEIQEIAYTAVGQVIKVAAQPLRIRKRVLLAQSAQEAAKMSESVNVADNEDVKKAKSISLITGGIDFQKGGLNTFFAENLVKRILPGSYSVPVTNPYSNDKNNLGEIYRLRSDLAGNRTAVGFDGVERPMSEPMPLDMLLHTNIEKGYNPDSVKMAAEAMAYRKKYPDKPIQLAGTSGGSYVVEEAIAILERAGITNIKGLGLTAPVNNLMTTASQRNYKSLVGEFDPLNVAMFGGKNVTDKDHPIYKATRKEMPFGMPGLLEESPLMSLIPGAGKGHALLPFLTKPMVNEQIQSFLGDAIDPVSPSFSKGVKSEPNLHFFKSQLDERNSLTRTFKAILGDGSTLRQIQRAGFNGAEGYTFAVPQKPEWRREYDFSAMMGNLPNARHIGKDIKPEFDEYISFLEEMRAGIVEFLDSGAKTKQSLVDALEKAIKFYPELRALQTRVLGTLDEQTRLTDLNTNPKKDTRTAREKYADNQRLARINAQFPQGQEYLKGFRNREKDKDLVPEARAGLESARNIAAQFNKSFATLQTLAKSGNLEEAAMLAASIKQMGVKAREEIKLIAKSLGESNNIGSTRLGSQLGQTLGQISSVQKKTDRIVSVNKLSIPNIDTVGVGENTIDGMRQGMEKELEKLKATAEKIPNTVTDVVTEKLKIQSPSEIMMGYGENTGDGYGIGVERSLSRVKEIVKSGIDDIAKSFDFVSQDPMNPGEELTSGLHDWYLSHRTSFDPSKLNNILGNGLEGRPSSDRAAKELELFGQSGTVYSALRHKRHGADNIKNEAYGAIEFLIDPSRISNKTTWLPADSDLERYQSIKELKERYGQMGWHFRQLNSVSPKASLMKNYEQNSGYVEAQTHAPILPSDISAIRIGSSQISPDQLYKKYGDSLLAFIRTALSKNIKVIGDFSPEFLKVAESVGININKGQSEGIRKSANEPIKAISEVAHQTIEKATEGLGKVSEIHKLNPAPIQRVSKKPNIPESEQKMMDEFNRMLAALQGTGENVGSGLSKGINSSLGDVESSSEKLANTVIDTVEKKLEIESPSRWGIRVGRFVGEGFTKGLEFLEGGNNGIIPIFIKVMNDIKSTVENGEITSSAEDFKNRLSRGFSRGLGSVPGFKDAKERFEGYKTFLKEIANPSTSAALGESLANGIVAAKELFVDFLKIPEKLVEGFNQVKVAFDSFVEGMNKVQKFGEIMDFLKSSIGNVVKVLGLLVVGKIILDLAPASIEVAANFENLERRIKFTSGSISEGAKNIAFLRSEAKRLNVSLSQTLEGGSKFFQTTKDTPIEGYQSRQVVSAVTQASAVYGLDLDNQQRAFTALEQMSGKTVVSQEELRQQLAEAIPNASQIAANAYGTTTQSMNQLLSTGRVLAEDFLPKFAQQLKAQTSSGVGDAVNSSVAITNKFNNSLTELQESIGKTLLPFKNFSLGIFASGIDLVTNNFQLLQSVLLITLIKLSSPVWMMFGAYLKEIAFSGNLVKGALLGMGQSIATLGKQMFILSMAMKAIDEIMMNFKDNSGAIGEQTRNVTQSINEQRKILNQQASVTETDDFSAFRERFSLNPFDNSTKKLKKQMEDSAKRTLEGRENTKNLLDASNSPAVQGAIQEIQAIDKSLDLIKMKRRAVIANNPGDIQELRKLQSQEKELSQRREKPLELFGGNKGNLDKQVETLKTYLEYWEELKKNPKLYQSEIEQINKIISTTKDDLAIVTAEQEKMVKAIKNSLTEMQKLAIEIRNIEAKFNDVRQARDTVLSSRKFNLFNSATDGVIQPGQVEYTNNLLTQVDLISKIADNLKQVREMSAQLNINGLDDVLKSQGLNKDTGIDTLKAAQERAIDGSKEKEILSSFIEVKKMQVQTVDMQQQLSEQRYNVTQSLHQQTKQVADYYRTAVREAKAVSVEFQKAQVTLQNSNVQNRLREALIGAGDNIYTQFVEGIINIISQTADIQKQQLEVRKQQIDYENNIQDIRIQAAELQRSLPGKIIPLDSSIADNFNLSLKKIDGTVDTINDGVKDVASSLSKGVVDAARKANTELDKLNGTLKNLNSVTDNWLDGFGNKITDTLGKLNLSVGVQANVENNTPASAANALEILQNTPINTDSTAKLTPTIPINPVIPANTIVSPIPGKTLFELTKTKFSPGQQYGASRDGGSRSHQGIDFGVNAGLKDGSGIVSMLPGLASARWYDKEAKTIVVEVRTKIPNGNKIDIKYGHIGLESAVKALGIKLEKDDISSNVVDVNAGQWIGNIKSDKYSGNNPANAHLHLEVIARRQNGYAVLNPKQFINDLFRANQEEQPNIFKRIFRKITGTQPIPEARGLKPFNQSIAPVGQLPAAKTSSPVNPATQLQTTQVNRQPNSIADWPMPQQQATKSIILIPGHRIDIKTGTGGTSQTGSLNYKGENRTIESIGAEQAAKVFEKVLMQKGFKLIPAPPLPSARGDQARRDYQTEVAKLEKEKNAYALELHFDSPKGGKPGVIPGGQYDPSGKYLNQMDVSLASKFGAFSYFWGVGGKDVRQNPSERLGAPSKGITILELDKLDAKLTKLIEQGVKTGDFTDFEKAITPYAINAAEGLILAFNPSAKQSPPVPAMSVPQPTQTTKQKQQEYKNEQNPWQRFTNWLMPKAGAAEMPQQKTNTGVNFRKTSDVYKLNIDPKKTRLEFSKGWDQESKAYKDNNALGYFTAPMFNSWTGIERGKVVPVADLKFQDSVFRTTNRSAAKQRAFVSIDKQGKTRFGYGELTPDLEKQSDVFIGGLHSLYNNTEKQPAGYKGAYNLAGKQAAVLKTSRIRLIYGLNEDGTLSIVQSRKNLSIDEAKKLALKNGFIAAYLPDHGSKSRVIVPGVQAFDPTMRGEVGGYDSPTPYLIKVTAKPADKPKVTVKPADKPKVTAKPADKPKVTVKPADKPKVTVKPADKPKVTVKPAENAFISEPEPEKSGWDNFTNNTKKLVSNLGSQLPKFKLPKFKLPKFKLPEFKLPSFGDVPGFDSMGGTYAKPIAPRKQQSQIDPPKSGLPSRTTTKPITKPEVTTKPITKQSSPVPKLPNLPNLDPRIDTKFLQDVSKIAQSVGANPEDLLKVMLYETGGTLSPSIRNPRTKATGLIQFMPATARGLGTNIDALSQMTPQEQLFFVQKYLKQNSRGQKLDSFRKVLSTVFAGNPNASLGVGDGDITLGNYLKKAESRYGNTARQLTQIVVDGKAIDPDSMQSLVTEAARLKLDTAYQQREMNRVNSSLSIEQIRENELRQRLEAYRLIMSSQRTAFGDISSTKDSTLGTRRTVLEGLSPNMSNAGRFGIQIQDLQRKLEKDVEALQQIIRDTDGAIAQKPDLQAAFDLAMKKFPNDPKLAADAIETNDLSFKATAFRNAEAKNNLAFLQSNINNILIAAIEDYNKKEFFRLREQDISQQSKVIEQLQQQLQLVQKLEEADPLNPLVLSIPALQKNIESLSITRDQYQQLLDLQRRYYDGGGKGGNMSEEAFQKEFRAILNVNSVKREGVDLNFNYADTVKRIKFATDELTKAQTLQSSRVDAVKIRSDRFNLQNKETGLVDIQGIKDQFALDSESANIAFQKLVLENSGNFSLSSQERLLKTLRDYRNFVERQNLSVAENINAIKEGELKNQQVMINKAFAEREAALNYESRSSSIENLKSDYANPFHVNALKRQLESEKLKLEYDKSLADLNVRLETESLGGVVRPEGYAESLKTDLLNNYLEKVKQVNRESKDFNSTIKDIAQQQLTSLSSGLTDVIMGTKSFGDALDSITKAFLSGALNALFNSWFSGKGGIGSLFGDIGKSLGFSKGGVVPNYADGGVIGAIGDALQRERQASGVKPVLAALTPGERVLTVRQNKRFEELQMEKVLNYADGGVVGRAVPSMSFTAPSQSSSVNIDIPINVSNGDSSTSVDVPQLRNSIRSAVLAEIQRQQRPGGALNK